MLVCDLRVGKRVRVPGHGADYGSVGTIAKLTRQCIEVKLDSSGKHCIIKPINLVPARAMWQNQSLMAGHAWTEDEHETTCTCLQHWVNGLAKELVKTQHYA